MEAFPDNKPLINWLEQAEKKLLFKAYHVEYAGWA